MGLFSRNSSDSESDRFTVHPVDNDDKKGSWAVRDEDTWKTESRHWDRRDAEARAEAKNNGKTRR